MTFVHAPARVCTHWCFSALASGYMFSRSWHRLHFFIVSVSFIAILLLENWFKFPVFLFYLHSLMKQAYLEMALVLVSNANKLKPPKTPDLPSRDSEIPSRATGTPSTPKERKISKKGSAKEKDRKDKESREKNKELEKELRTAWAAIRAAGVVASAHYKIGILTGDPEITALKLSEKAASSVPGLALFDLLGTDDVIKSSEDGALVAPDGIVTMGTTINNSNRVQITWLHLLGYLSVLRRQCSYAALGVHSGAEEGMKNSSMAVLPLFSTKKALKLSKMHSFLRNELGPYAAECCGVYPPQVLANYGPPSSGPQMMVTKPSQVDLTGDTSKKTGENFVVG